MENNLCGKISFNISLVLTLSGFGYYTCVSLFTEDGFKFVSRRGVPMLIILMAFIFINLFHCSCASRIEIYSICGFLKYPRPEPDPIPDLSNGTHQTTEKCKLTDCEIISIVLLVFMDVGFIFYYYYFVILWELHEAGTIYIIFLVIFIIVLIVATIFTFFGASRIKEPIFRGHQTSRPIRILIEHVEHQQVTEESDEICCCRISRLFRRSIHPEPTDDMPLGPIPSNAVHRDRQPDFPIPID